MSHTASKDQAKTSNERLKAWVEDVAALTQPEEIHWCDGSAEEYDQLAQALIDAGTFERLSEAKRPNSYLALSDPADVARVEDRTFICSKDEADAGPTNNWREPAEMRQMLNGLFEGSMRGRTMYVVPFSMGPLGSPISHIGVQLTDSAYVACSMRIMTRMGQDALDVLGSDGDYVPCVHSVGAPLAPGAQDVPWPCNADNKYIVHFPETREIWSFGSGYGGNALLGKKCFALRIASVMAHEQGWLAEHMLILKLTSPEGEVKHIAGAFPSACGKTNLAMMIPTLEDWKVETIGDDIAWMKFGEDGKLYAVNPEVGFFGVAPGTGAMTNPNAIDTLSKQLGVHELRAGPTTATSGGRASPASRRTTRSTGAATSGRRTPRPPRRIRTPGSPHRRLSARRSPPSGRTRRAWPSTRCCSAGAARPSCRSCTRLATGSTACSSARSCPPRRPPRRRAPWASSASTRWPCCRSAATTWPTTSAIGSRWVLARARSCRKIFYVNWFRKDENGKFMWPGYGENSRVLAWVFRRCEGTAEARDTAIGLVPPVGEGGIDTTGSTSREETMARLLEVDVDGWKAQMPQVQQHYAEFGAKLPSELRSQLEALEARLSS